MFKEYKTEKTEKWKIFHIKTDGKVIKVLMTWHSLDRLKVWSLEETMILSTLLNPEEVLVGHNERFIAHRRYGEHLARIVYEYDMDLPTVVTVYFPYSKRYFEGGKKFADKVLS